MIASFRMSEVAKMGKELRELNPKTDKGYRRYEHFQLLTANTGNVHLDRQITATTMIMKVSDSKPDFEDNFDKAFAKEYQRKLPLVVNTTVTKN
jgi:hypothetical protein